LCGVSHDYHRPAPGERPSFRSANERPGACNRPCPGTGIPRSGGDTLNMKRNLLSVALATATLMIATAAQAQDASATADRQAPPEETATPADDATELDRVTVTGIRRGIEDAIEAKRTSTSIVESVSAEDIGKLPDMSIADSLARLPGLTAQRFGN